VHSGSGSACGFWITLHFFSSLRNMGFSRFFTTSHTVTRRILLNFSKWLTPEAIDHNILGAIWQTSGYGLIWIRIPAHFRLIFRPWQSMRSVSALVANVMVSANLKKSVLKGLDIVFAALGLLGLHKIESPFWIRHWLHNKWGRPSSSHVLLCLYYSMWFVCGPMSLLLCTMISLLVCVSWATTGQPGNSVFICSVAGTARHACITDRHDVIHVIRYYSNSLNESAMSDESVDIWAHFWLCCCTRGLKWTKCLQNVIMTSYIHDTELAGKYL